MSSKAKNHMHDAEIAMLEMQLRQKDEEIARLRRIVADMQAFLHGAAIQFRAVAGSQ